MAAIQTSPNHKIFRTFFKTFCALENRAGKARQKEHSRRNKQKKQDKQSLRSRIRETGTGKSSKKANR